MFGWKRCHGGVWKSKHLELGRTGAKRGKTLALNRVLGVSECIQPEIGRLKSKRTTRPSSTTVRGGRTRAQNGCHGPPLRPSTTDSSGVEEDAAALRYDRLQRMAQESKKMPRPSAMTVHEGLPNSQRSLCGPPPRPSATNGSESKKPPQSSAAPVHDGGTKVKENAATLR